MRLQKIRAVIIIFFLDGTIRIDFNGFYVEGIVDFIVNGGDIVFLDSSSAGTGVSEYSNSFGIELKDGIDATISGGYFHGEGADLFARKDVSEENPLRLVISGGLFTSKQTGNYNAGIVITWTGSAVAPNLPGMIATNSVLSPATVYTGKSSTWYYAQTEQNVCVVRTANGTLIDGGGLSYWLSNLNSGVSRKFVFAGFAKSQEWKSLCGQYGIDPGGYTSDEPRDQNLQVTAFVQRLYSLCLGRSGDATGINNWTSALINKTGDGVHVAHGFFFSQEMINRVLSNEAYVECSTRCFSAGHRMPPQIQLDGAAEFGYESSLRISRICSLSGI